jgi:hypothetical protein
VDLAPPPTRVDVDPTQLGQLLTAVEQRIHRAGWEKLPPQLLVLFDNQHGTVDQLFRRICGQNPNLGPATRVGRFSAQRMVNLGPPWVDLESWVALRNMAMNVAYAGQAEEPARLLSTLREPGIVGFAFAGYGWTPGPHTPPDLAEKAFAWEMDWDDVPGAIEARTLYAIDFTDQVHQVVRHRGQAPVLAMNGPWIGDITTSLRILVAAVDGTVPPAEQFSERWPTIKEHQQRNRIGRPS